MQTAVAFFLLRMAYMAAIFVTPSVFLLALVQLVLHKNLVVPRYRPCILILATKKGRNSSLKDVVALFTMLMVRRQSLAHRVAANVADDPSSALDVMTQKKVMMLFTTVAPQGPS
jgi:hypothetical protein